MTTISEPRIVEFPQLIEDRGKLNAKRDDLAKILAEAGPTYDMSLVKSLTGCKSTEDKVEHIQQINAEIDELATKVRGHLVVAKAAGMAMELEGSAECGADEGSDGQIPGQRGARASFGEMLMASEAIKGRKTGSGIGPSARIDVPLKNLLFSTGNGWDPEDTRTGKLVEYATRPAPAVITIFPQTTTDKSTVLYMEETVFSNTAAETAEGDMYPEAQLKVEEKSSEVRKIAIFLPVTDEQFEDEPRARAYVENRLPFMLRQRLDQQLMTGSGSSPNLRGVENVSGIQTQALGADPVPDAIYKCMTSIRELGYAEPSHVLIRASKWQSVALLKTADGVYIWGHPSMSGPTTIWGVPVITTTAVTSTKAVMGDFTNFSEVAVRRGIDVQISNSHADNFAKGVLALRADVRVASMVYRPAAFGCVTGLA